MGAFKFFTKLADLFDVGTYDLPANNLPLANALGAAVNGYIVDDGAHTLDPVAWGSPGSLDAYEGTVAGDPTVTLANNDYYSYAPVSSQDCVVYLPPTPALNDEVNARIANSNATSPGAVDIYDSDEVTLVDSVAPGDDVVVHLRWDGADWVATAQDAAIASELRPDVANGHAQKGTLTADVLFRAPVGLDDLHSFTWSGVQDGTGGYAITFGAGILDMFGNQADISGAGAGDAIEILLKRVGSTYRAFTTIQPAA